MSLEKKQATFAFEWTRNIAIQLLVTSFDAMIDYSQFVPRFSNKLGFLQWMQLPSKILDALTTNLYFLPG